MVGRVAQLHATAVARLNAGAAILLANETDNRTPESVDLWDRMRAAGCFGG